MLISLAGPAGAEECDVDAMALTLVSPALKKKKEKAFRYIIILAKNLFITLPSFSIYRQLNNPIISKGISSFNLNASGNTVVLIKNFGVFRRSANNS